MAKKLIYILDACPMIALLDKENGWENVYQLIKRGNHGEIALYMNIVNFLEVYYDRLKIDVAAACDFRRTIHNSAIQIIDLHEDDIFYEAGRLKAEYRHVSLADAVGIATAMYLDGVFVTCDHHELEKVEQGETVPFLWVR
jgi:predicted nucleic acid-binding protein